MSEALYVHVPFCNHICAYCDFMRCIYREALAEQWLNAVQRDLQEQNLLHAQSVYIGGGTPSALSHTQLRRLLEMLQPSMKQAKEVTMEANADSFDQAKIALCAMYGVNRISLGAQSFDTALLRRMGRVADEEMIVNCIAHLHRAGIDNISLDLIYALPDQTMAQWESDLRKACALPITHLSLYSLTIEENSRFGREHVSPCDEELEADFYEAALRICKDNGFEHYEISSFAKDHHYSMHNLAYWHYDDFCGIGCGASGKQKHHRYDNTRNLHTYITRGPEPKITELSKADEMFETMMMGLRIQTGVDDDRFRERYGCSYHERFGAAIQKHIALGNLRDDPPYLHTTKQGMMLLHEILVDFL